MKAIAEGQWMGICWPKALAFGLWYFWRKTSSLSTVCKEKSIVYKTKMKTMGCRKGSKNNSNYHEAGGK
jgi:hypothetical protein